MVYGRHCNPLPFHGHPLFQISKYATATGAAKVTNGLKCDYAVTTAAYFRQEVYLVKLTFLHNSAAGLYLNNFEMAQKQSKFCFRNSTAYAHAAAHINVRRTCV